jgi:Asp-tRNA(Asn)/Glu-tRNA(Gln) amidotransferase A subunit family amidase
MAGLNMGVVESARAFRADQLLISDYIDQLESYFAEREPSVLSFIPEDGRFDRLRREAATLMARYPIPDSRPALFGVPFGVKDIFHVNGFTTRAGSQLPIEELQGQESASVTALKQAGALVMGKTVTTEFAYFGPGPTRNPHNREHTPGGSSSGSAAAVGAGLCPLALGTQTIGSVVRPASFCGCVGYKPTYERISRAGVIPLSPSFDHIGIFARDVAGVELAASVVVENWRTGELAIRPTLGIPVGPFLERASVEMLTHFESICEKLAAAGYAIKKLNVMPDFDEIRERHYLIAAADAAEVHKNWFPKYRDLYHAKTVELLERGHSVSADTLARALKDREQFSKAMYQTMENEGVDLWISPSAVGPAPKGLESTGDPVMNLPWSQAGLPSLNIPAGNNLEGLPLGFQLTARLNNDEQLLAWGKTIEKVIGVNHSS